MYGEVEDVVQQLLQSPKKSLRQHYAQALISYSNAQRTTEVTLAAL